MTNLEILARDVETIAHRLAELHATAVTYRDSEPGHHPDSRATKGRARRLANQIQRAILALNGGR